MEGSGRWRMRPLCLDLPSLSPHSKHDGSLRSRFAMFAAIGIIAAELYTGKDAIEQFGL